MLKISFKLAKRCDKTWQKSFQMKEITKKHCKTLWNLPYKNMTSPLSLSFVVVAFRGLTGLRRAPLGSGCHHRCRLLRHCFQGLWSLWTQRLAKGGEEERLTFFVFFGWVGLGWYGLVWLVLLFAYDIFLFIVFCLLFLFLWIFSKLVLFVFLCLFCVWSFCCFGSDEILSWGLGFVFSFFLKCFLRLVVLVVWGFCYVWCVLQICSDSVFCIEEFCFCFMFPMGVVLFWLWFTH